MKTRKETRTRKRTEHIKRHAVQRAQERYGISIQPSDLRKIAELILANKSKIVAKRSCSRSIHQVEFNGVTMNVMYDKTRHHVVTVLPIKEKT